MQLARTLKNNLKGKASGFNLLLARHEDENIPFRVAQVDGNGLLHCSLYIVLLGGLAEQGLHREGAAWDLEDWHAAKEVRELAGVQRCGGDNQPEVPSLSHHLMHRSDVDEATYVVADMSHATVPKANVNADYTLMQCTPNSVYTLHVSGACCRDTLKPVYEQKKWSSSGWTVQTNAEQHRLKRSLADAD